MQQATSSPSTPPGTARGQVSQHAVEHDSESITRSYLALCHKVSRGISTDMSHMTDMCVRQYAVVATWPGREKSQHLGSCPRRESCSGPGFGLLIAPLTGTSRQSELDPGWPWKHELTCPLNVRANGLDPKDSWRLSESSSESLLSQSTRRQAEAYESRNFVHRRRETNRNEVQPEDDDTP